MQQLGPPWYIHDLILSIAPQPASESVFFRSLLPIETSASWMIDDIFCDCVRNVSWQSLRGPISRWYATFHCNNRPFMSHLQTLVSISLYSILITILTLHRYWRYSRAVTFQAACCQNGAFYSAVLLRKTCCVCLGWSWPLVAQHHQTEAFGRLEWGVCIHRSTERSR